jgi:DNA-binding beta-propeller fold protein YncE
VYVADAGNRRVQKFTRNGIYLTEWRTPRLSGIAVDSIGTVYITVPDIREEYAVCAYDAEGRLLRGWGTYGDGDGQFRNAQGIAIGRDGRVHVSDRKRSIVQIFDGEGAFLGSFGSTGIADGQFRRPVGVALGPDGSIYVADEGNCRVQKFDEHGTHVASWGGDPLCKTFRLPSGVACDAAGDVYVVDRGAHEVQKRDPNGLELCRWGEEGEKYPGEFLYPFGIAASPNGVYVTDTQNHRIQRFGYIEAPLPEGAPVSVTLEGSATLNVTFAQVIEHDWISLVLDTNGPAPPYQYERWKPVPYFNLETKYAHFAGFVDICVQYDPTWFTAEAEELLKLFQWDPATQTWTDRTVSHDPANNVICAQVSEIRGRTLGLFTPVKQKRYGTVTGLVAATCADVTTPLEGVSVSAYEYKYGHMVGSAATGPDGYYFLSELPDSAYLMTVLTPLGYTTSTEQILVKVKEGTPAQADFAMDCLLITRNPRSVGFWKHQVAVALSGKGNAQVSAETFCQYLDVIVAHFNSNDINPVIVYQAPSWGGCTEKIVLAKDVLNLWGSQDMIARARQQLLALLLNVAAGYLSLTEVASADGATVSQAITYCDYLIDAEDGDYERAKTIADEINNGRTVPAGMIPLSTRQIAYRLRPLPVEPGLRYVQPNPAAGSPVRIGYAVPAPGADVELAVYDAAGRRVAALASGRHEPGVYELAWGRTGGDASQLRAGVYFLRLKIGLEVVTRRVIVLR